VDVAEIKNDDGSTKVRDVSMALTFATVNLGNAETEPYLWSQADSGHWVTILTKACTKKSGDEG
jgi:hypothetical protein